MTLDYVKVSVSILQIRDLSLTQKIILGLVTSLAKGLKLDNSAIGKILNISASQVSHVINDMERKGYVRIENRQSKYRTIYLAENPKVKAVLLNGKPESKSVLLSGLTGTTSRKTTNITKGTEKDITEGVSCLEFMTFWNQHGNLRKICEFTKPRKRLLAARSKKPKFADNWKLIIDKLSQSPFHTGKNKSKWKADVTWLLTGDNYIKILELDDSEDYSAALAQHTRDVTEEEAEELLREVTV